MRISDWSSDVCSSDPVAIVYLCEHDDARETCRIVEAEGRKAIAIAGDVGEAAFCNAAVEQTVRELDRLDILVNHAGEQHPAKDIQVITAKQLLRTFQTNIFGMLFMVRAALAPLKVWAKYDNIPTIQISQE